MPRQSHKMQHNHQTTKSIQCKHIHHILVQAKEQEIRRTPINPPKKAKKSHHVENNPNNHDQKIITAFFIFLIAGASIAEIYTHKKNHEFRRAF